MATRKRKNRAEAENPEQRLLLDQLKELSAKVGIEVREEKLHRGAGYTVRGGVCKVDGRDVLLLDRNATVAERVDLALDFLAGSDLDDLYVEPDLRRLIERRLPAEAADSAEPPEASLAGESAAEGGEHGEPA